MVTTWYIFSCLIDQYCHIWYLTISIFIPKKMPSLSLNAISLVTECVQDPHEIIHKNKGG